MGDSLQAGKSSHYEASQLGWLSLLPSMGQKNELQISGWVVINGDGECSTTAASLGGSEAQADWFCRRLPGACAALIKWTGWTLTVAVHCQDDSTINILLLYLLHLCDIQVWSSCPFLIICAGSELVPSIMDDRLSFIICHLRFWYQILLLWNRGTCPESVTTWQQHKQDWNPQVWRSNYQAIKPH